MVTIVSSAHQAQLGFLRLGLRRLGRLGRDFALLRCFRQFVVHQLFQLAAGETTYIYICVLYIYIGCNIIYIQRPTTKKKRIQLCEVRHVLDIS